MKTYDFIIVGGGSAGCVLANRLTEDPRNRVALLEAGGRDRNPLIRVPILAGLLYTMPSLNWGYETEPQAHLGNRMVSWPRGKVLGGSSSINGMVYIRGHPRDYDEWREAGLEGWAYADVLPYFKRSEAHDSRADSFHGRDGPMGVGTSVAGHPLYEAFFEAGRQAAHPETEDFNGMEQEGFGRHDFTIRGGRRESTGRVFLRPAMRRRNLTVVVKAQATRVLFDGKRAGGVEYVHGGKTKTVRANREVILAGGAVNSPALLQLSGIGDGGALQRLGISVIADLPGVGQNLQDHLGVYVQHECLQPITLYGLFRPDRAVLAVSRAYLMGRGPGASVPLAGGAYLHTRPEIERPDIKCVLIPGLSLETSRAGQGRHGFQIAVHQLRPESRGFIALPSADPGEKPLIQPNYLAAPTDIQTLRDAVTIVRSLLARPSFDPFRGREIAPGGDVRTDTEIDTWIRGNARTVFHPVGTCKMGTDVSAVVDGSLRVRDVDGLRVVDASVMPRIPGGNTNAPTIMIAEKAADMILGKPPLPSQEVRPPQTRRRPGATTGGNNARN